MPVYLVIFVYFACIAAAGLCLASLRKARVALPGWLGVAHGLAGLVGIGAFFVVNLNQSDAGDLPAIAWWSLLAFAGGLIGGLIFFRVLFPGRAPGWALAGHGLMAILGLAALYPLAFAG